MDLCKVGAPQLVDFYSWGKLPVKVDITIGKWIINQHINGGAHLVLATNNNGALITVIIVLIIESYSSYESQPP